MLKNNFERRLCDKYGTIDKDNKVHCRECPLNLTAELQGEIACKATHHYDRKLKEWVPDDWDDPVE